MDILNKYQTSYNHNEMHSDIRGTVIFLTSVMNKYNVTYMQYIIMNSSH